MADVFWHSPGKCFIPGVGEHSLMSHAYIPKDGVASVLCGYSVFYDLKDGLPEDASSSPPENHCPKCAEVAKSRRVNP